MGTSHDLFHGSVMRRYETLHKRITLGPEELNSQKNKKDRLETYLRTDLESKTGFPIKVWLQGSYKFDTQIRPAKSTQEYDIDMGLYFCASSDVNDFPISPSQVKSYLQQSLLSYIHEDIKEVLIPPKERCARVHYNQNFHIDIPAYHLNTATSKGVLATQTQGWEDSDPKALYLWFRDCCSNERLSKIKRQIRYLKCWSNIHCSDSTMPSSILLTILVTQAAISLPVESLHHDDTGFRLIVTSIHNRLKVNRVVLNPATPETNEDLAARFSSDDYDNFLAKLNQLEIITNEAVFSTDVFKSAFHWSKVFSYFFPMPDTDYYERSNNNAPSLPAIVPDVEITAIPRQNSNRIFSGRNNIGPIPRQCNLSFTITNSDLFPDRTKFEWTVRNEGREAEEKSDLGHFSGEGTSTTDSSAYNGVHFMDCAAVLDGQLIALRRCRVEISSAPMPPRQKAARYRR